MKRKVIRPLLLLVIGLVGCYNQVEGQIYYEDPEEKKAIDKVKVDSVKFSVKRLYSKIQFGPLLEGPGIMISYDYTFQRTTRIGYGGGLDYSKYSNQKPYEILSLYGKFKSYYSNAKNSFFASGKLGYGHPMGSTNNTISINKKSGGIFGGVNIGYRIGIKPPILEFALGLRLQKANFEFENFGVTIIDDALFKRAEVTLGMIF